MSVTKTLNVPEHIQNIILNEMEWDKVEGKTVGRIKLHLDRKTYLDVDKVLKKLGGKWNRAKRFAGHVFDEDPRHLLQGIEEESKLTVNVYGFFRTPRQVVDQMLNVTAPRTHEWVLEPSAGDGAILDVLVERTGDRHRVHAVELHEGRQRQLRQNGYHVVGGDFMEFDGEESYDVVLMNPPFENAQDKKHILRAYHDCLKPGGRMAAIAAAGVKFRADYQDLRDLVGEHGQMWDLSPDTFEGTSVNAVFIYLEKPRVEPRPRIETVNDETFEQGRLL